jgi:hypothetical protein
MLSWIVFVCVAGGQFAAGNWDAHTSVRNLRYFGVSGVERSAYLGPHPSPGRIYARINGLVGAFVAGEAAVKATVKHGQAKALPWIAAASTIGVNMAGAIGNNRQYDAARRSGILRGD